MLPAVDDVAREFSQAERKFRAEIKKCAQDHKETSEEEECAADFAGSVHQEDFRGNLNKM